MWSVLTFVSRQHVNKRPTQAVAPAAPKPTKGKSKEQTIEVLNPGSAAPAATPVDDDDDEELPDLTPAALAFSKIKPSDYVSSFAAISKDPKLYTDEEATDALLVEAFNAEMRGDKTYAQGCVHQSLLLQYCRKLGKDGVALFFKK